MANRIHNCKIKQDPISELDKMSLIWNYAHKKPMAPKELIQILSINQFQYRKNQEDLALARKTQNSQLERETLRAIECLEKDIDHIQGIIRQYNNENNN